MAAEALGVLAHVATLWARLWRRDQPGEQTLVATNGSLELAAKNRKKINSATKQQIGFI